jgi:diadenosine tetraphosphatase ApaH/serine/threonine PP2A family protein phosphatase
MNSKGLNKAKLEKLTDKIYQNPSIFLEINQDELAMLITAVMKITKLQRKLIDLPRKDILIAGDIHGDLTQLKRAISLYNNKIVDMVVFNGDVIDRGPEMLECIGLLIAAMIKHPKDIFYIRGNHELESINSVYGFRGYCTQFFGYDGYLQFQHFFETLPLAAKIDDFGFICHGGIPTDTIFFHLMRLELKKNEPVQGSSGWQLIWNDPDTRVKTFIQSHRGEGCYKFGRKPFDEFMRFHELDIFIRAHTAYREGYRWFFDNKLLSVFSSNVGPYQHVKPNFAVVTREADLRLIKCNTISIQKK